LTKIDYNHNHLFNKMLRISCRLFDKNNIKSLQYTMQESSYVVPEVEENAININSRSSDFRARILSNLINRPFQIDGQMCASVEAFFAGTLYPLNDIRRARGFASCYAYSQKMVAEGIDLFHHLPLSIIHWNNKEYTYASPEHKNLLERCILESILQNDDRKQALLDTDGLEIKHITGFPENPNTFLTRLEFCQILTRIRSKLLRNHNQQL